LDDKTEVLGVRSVTTDSAVPVMGTNKVRTQRFSNEFPFAFDHSVVERLLVTFADGNDHRNAFTELFDEAARARELGTAGDDNFVKRRRSCAKPKNPSPILVWTLS